MTTTVQVSDDGGGTWREIDYEDVNIILGTSDVQVVPESNVVTHAREDVSADQPYRVQVDGTTKFEGFTVSAGTKRASSGTKRRDGQMDVKARHNIAQYMGDMVSFDLTNLPGSDPLTDEDVMDLALSDVGATTVTLTYNATPITLTDGNDYAVDNRQLKLLFRDMVDRRNFVWWVKPVTDEIVVEPRGNQGLWNSLEAQADKIEVGEFDQGSVETVRNDVRVVGTGSEPPVEGTASDSTSVNTYGRRPEVFNVSYIEEVGEATDFAESLLITDPLVSAEVGVHRDVGTIVDPIVNYTVDLQDDSKNIDESGLMVEKQVIKQRQATLSVGQGSGEGVANTNRRTKSAEDKMTRGAVGGGGGSLSLKYSLETAKYSPEHVDLPLSSESISAPDDMTWNDDGTQLFMCEDSGSIVAEYSLSTAYDITTMSHVQDVSGFGSPSGIAWNNDGTKLYLANNNRIKEFSLSTPYDLSTRSENDTLDISNEVTLSGTITWNDDGSRVYVVASNAEYIYQYNCSPNFDVSTGTTDSNNRLNIGVTSDPYGIALNDDGAKLYTTGYTAGVGDNPVPIYEYHLRTAYDVNSGIYTYKWDGPSWLLGTGILWNDDGTELISASTYNPTGLAVIWAGINR